MFAMQSVLHPPESPKRQVAAMAAFFHLTVATVLLVGLAWRIESVDAVSFPESFLPVAFLPAEWTAPLVAQAKAASAAAVEKTPAVVQPKEISDAPTSATPSAIESEAIAGLGEEGSPGTETLGASGSSDAGGVGEGSGTAVAAASIVWHAGIVPPRVLFRLDPKYPEVARVAHRQGAVVVEAEIATDGTLRSARVVSPPLGFGLEQSALEAIGNWKFGPARYGDRPIAVYYRWNVLFSLR